MKRVLVSLLLVIVLAVLGACGGDEEPESGPMPTTPSEATAMPESPGAEAVEQPTPTPTSQPPTATPEPMPTAVEEEPQEEEVDALLTQQELASLDSLDSYRAYTLITSQGTTLDGQEEDTTVEISSAYTRDPAARYFSMTFEDRASEDPEQAGPDTVEFYQVGDTFYASFEEGWIQMSGEETPFMDPDSEFMVNSGVLFSNLEDLRRQRPDENVNGVGSRHYTFNETALNRWLGNEGQVMAEGEVWIAEDGGYVTRYVVDVTVEEGGGGFLAPNLTVGTLHMEFELSDVNSPDIIIEVPEDATAGTSLPGFEDAGFPVPPGGTVAMSSPEFAMITVNLPPGEVQTFYEEALAELGWTKNEDASGGFGDFITLEFSSGANSLSLLISPDEAEGETQVMVGSGQ